MKSLSQSPILSQNIFDDDHYFVSRQRLFYAYFSKVPNEIEVENVKATKLIEALAESAQWKTRATYYRKKCSESKIEYRNVIFLFEESLLVEVVGDDDSANILSSDDAQGTALLMLKFIKGFQLQLTKAPQIRIIISGNGLETKTLQLPKRRVQLREQYNDDLVELHPKIIDQVNTKNDSGLILFHGAPGTGKTTYIRSLLPKVKKKVLFLPPALASTLDSPSMFQLLTRNVNSVLVIEDGEELLVPRGTTGNSAISMLLSLTDGLLGACLGIQIIATFNTDLRNIDAALMRPGRLRIRYEFKPLTIQKTRRLIELRGALGVNVEREMTLAEIYNTSEVNYSLLKSQPAGIGFRPHNHLQHG